MQTTLPRTYKTPNNLKTCVLTEDLSKVLGYGTNRQIAVPFLYTIYKQLENVIVRRSLFIIARQHYTIATINTIKKYVRQKLKNIIL